jgi:hypothetical protein
MGNASEEFLEKRRAELETYLSELLSVPIIRASEEVSRTLELSSIIDVATLSPPATASAPAPSSDGPVSAPASSSSAEPSSEYRCVCACGGVCVRVCVRACVCGGARYWVCVSLICVCTPAQHAHLVL